MRKTEDEESKHERRKKRDGKVRKKKETETR